MRSKMSSYKIAHKMRNIITGKSKITKAQEIHRMQNILDDVYSPQTNYFIKDLKLKTVHMNGKTYQNPKAIVSHQYEDLLGHVKYSNDLRVSPNFILKLTKTEQRNRDKDFQDEVNQKFGYNRTKSSDKPIFSKPHYTLVGHAPIQADNKKSDVVQLSHHDPNCTCNGSPFFKQISQLNKGYACPIQAQKMTAPIGERMVGKFLKDNGISYLYGKTLNVSGIHTENKRVNAKVLHNSKDIGTYGLHADFFVPKSILNTKHSFVIEVDGSQHNYPGYYGGQAGFLHQDKNDRIKDNYLRRQGVHVVRIPEYKLYTEQFKKHLAHVHMPKTTTSIKAKGALIAETLDRDLISKLNINNIKHHEHNKHHLAVGHSLLRNNLSKKHWFATKRHLKPRMINNFKVNKKFANEAVKNHMPSYSEQVRLRELTPEYKKNFNSTHYNRFDIIFARENMGLGKIEKPKHPINVDLKQEINPKHLSIHDKKVLDNAERISKHHLLHHFHGFNKARLPKFLKHRAHSYTTPRPFKPLNLNPKANKNRTQQKKIDKAEIKMLRNNRFTR